MYLLIFTRGLVYMDRMYSDIEGTTLTWVTGMHLKFDLEAPTQPILKTRHLSIVRSHVLALAACGLQGHAHASAARRHNTCIGSRSSRAQPSALPATSSDFRPLILIQVFLLAMLIMDVGNPWMMINSSVGASWPTPQPPTPVRLGY